LWPRWKLDGARRLGLAGAALAVAAAVCGHAPSAAAQGVPTIVVRRQPPAPTPFPTDVLIQSVTTAAAPRSQHPVAPLPPAIAFRLQRAIDLRVSGLVDQACDTLIALARLLPHHPMLVAELARTQLARQNWSAVERLGTAERAAARDSTLLGEELATALERLGRPRDAMHAALEAWAASPVDAAWASGALLRLAPTDLRAATTGLEAVAGPRPWRSDLTLGLARLHALAGRPADALRVLADAERRSGRSGLRAIFSEESLRSGRTADTTAALAVLTDLAGDQARQPEERLAAARRAWAAAQASGREAEWAPRLAQAMREIPAERWGPELLLALVRSLQRAGHGAEARSLLAANPTLEARMPELALERALGVAREGPPERALPLLDSLTRIWPSARFMLAEVQFFSGELDSAHANYERVAAAPVDDDAAAALDRMYLLEESPGSPLRLVLAQIAYERWRGATSQAMVLADSLWRMQAPRREYAARAGLELASLRLEAGDARGALLPLAVICDSLADDRLAPLARQRAGDAYLTLGDAKNAVGQYEECLARYPRAWNSAEVRRRLERLRKDRRL